MVLLLVNLGVMEAYSVVNMIRLWPLILIALGLQVMFGRDNPWIGNLLAVVLVMAAVVFIYFAPTLGLTTGPTALVTEHFNEPLDGASSGTINLSVDHGTLEVGSLHASSNLFEATATHNQRISFSSGGNDNKSVNFTIQQEDFFDIFDWFEQERNTIKIGLSDELPLVLNIDHGAGPATLNLSDLELIRLEADNGSGSLTVYLPSGDFPIELDSGSGSLDIEVAPHSVLDLRAGVGSGRIVLSIGADSEGKLDVDAGSGTITIQVPDGVGVQISGSTGSGGVYKPNDYVRVSGSDQIGPSESGTWQSPNFNSAEQVIYIEFNVGSGSIRIND